MDRIFRTALGALALATVVIFTVQNLTTMTLNFLNWSVEAPSFTIIAVSFVVGMIVGRFVIARI